MTSERTDQGPALSCGSAGHGRPEVEADDGRACCGGRRQNATGFFGAGVRGFGAYGYLAGSLRYFCCPAITM